MNITLSTLFLIVAAILMLLEALSIPTGGRFKWWAFSLFFVILWLLTS